MKKQILTVVAICSLGAATAAFGAAARGAGIVGGPHDMRVYGYVDNQDRACAFCHTPHHAATSGQETYLPLWSRTGDTKAFNTAYASATINAAELNEGTSDKAIGPTRLCMSCHDGTIAPDQHYGATAGAAVLTGDNFSAVGNGAGVGSGAAGLSNDHPVGFAYDVVAVGPETGDPTATDISNADATQDPWIRNPNASFTGNTLNLKISDRLYAANNKGYMTCATCHDVHNKKNVYATSGAEPVNYLVLAPQAGSALCLSCHIK